MTGQCSAGIRSSTWAFPMWASFCGNHEESHTRLKGDGIGLNGLWTKTVRAMRSLSPTGQPPGSRHSKKGLVSAFSEKRSAAPLIRAHEILIQKQKRHREGKGQIPKRRLWTKDRPTAGRSALRGTVFVIRSDHVWSYPSRVELFSLAVVVVVEQATCLQSLAHRTRADFLLPQALHR